MNPTIRLVMLLTFLLSLFMCKPKKKEGIDPDILNFLLAQKTGADGACQKFLLSESNCVGTPDSSVTVCPALVTNLKSKITPQDKATDTVTELYFNCFTEANVVYNSGINCQKSSFNTTNDYRKAQRVTTAGNTVTSVNAWKLQFNNCASLDNGIPPASSGLKETGTKLTADPFQ